MNQVDARFGRTFKVSRFSIKGMVDLYNLFNKNTVIRWDNTYGTAASRGAAWLTPVQILGGRLLKFGVQVDF